MPKLNPSQQKVLKLLHLIAAACWLGGAVAMLCLAPLRKASVLINDGQLHGLNMALDQVDIWVVVIPGASACLITGLIYCIFTKWGFFRHGWVAAKLILTVAACLFGTFFLGPCVETMVELSAQLGLGALSDPAYLSAESKNLYGAIFGNLTAILIMMILSVWKPKKKKAKAAE